MINILEKKNCCGCTACMQICPKMCIQMVTDNEGFLYPQVNNLLCIDCGLCERVCPVINQNSPHKPHKVYAAKNKNENIRLKSSSGGVFSMLALNIINEGGIVFGAKFDENWNVSHDYTETTEGIESFRGSKYVQSSIGNNYKVTKEFLKNNRKVLFSGTPCQIAGLKKYLQKDYENLLTVEVVCHGAPSPKIWREYLKYKCVNNNASKIIDISFRDKTKGWKLFGLKISYDNSHSINNNTELTEFKKDLFMKGFLRNIYLRPSCYDCPARKCKSGADISLGDFWGIQNFFPEFDDDKGCSLVLLNSNKGKLAFEQLDTERLETSYEIALKGNHVLESSVALTKYTEEFWKTGNIDSIEYICKKMKPSLPKRLLLKIYNFFKN